jgi:hypothetical protein
LRLLNLIGQLKRLLLQSWRRFHFQLQDGAVQSLSDCQGMHEHTGCSLGNTSFAPTDQVVES